MAAKKRALRPAINEQSGDGRMDEECLEDSDSGPDDMLDTEVTVDFEARTPDDDDYHGIQRLLQQLFLKARVDLGELTNEILKQNYVASVVTQSVGLEDDDEDDDGSEIFGLLTVVNMTEKRNLECVRQIKSLLLDKAPTDDHRKRLSSLLDDGAKQVGLIVSERFTNIPPQIALPLYETLQKDMDGARAKNMKFDFTDFVIISKIYKSSSGQGPETNRIMYANEEDGFFFEVTDFHFDYSVWEQSDSALAGNWEEDDEEWKTFRRVLTFPAARLSSVVTKLQNELKSAAQIK